MGAEGSQTGLREALSALKTSRCVARTSAIHSGKNPQIPEFPEISEGVGRLANNSGRT